MWNDWISEALFGQTVWTLPDPASVRCDSVLACMIGEIRQLHQRLGNGADEGDFERLLLGKLTEW